MNDPGVDQNRRKHNSQWARSYYQRNIEKMRKKGCDWARAKRQADPEAYRVSQRTRNAAKRLERLKQRAANAQRILDRKPETLKEWFLTQSKFAEWTGLARALGICDKTIYAWRDGRSPRFLSQRKKLYEITGLAIYADAASWNPREERARKIGEQAAVPLIAELVVRCGLPPRQLLGIRVSQIEDAGIRLRNDRLIPFGDCWDCVNRNSLQAWRDRANPNDLLFFSRSPVDRQQPASPSWINTTLRASGITMPKRRVGYYMRHFAGDFARTNTDKNFVRHAMRDHLLSKSTAWGLVRSLRKQRDSIAKGVFSRGQCKPEDAYDLLFQRVPRTGRPAAKRDIFVQAKTMKGSGKSWAQIAKALTPEEFRIDWHASKDRIRKGVNRLKKLKQ